MTTIVAGHLCDRISIRRGVRSAVTNGEEGGGREREVEVLSRDADEGETERRGVGNCREQVVYSSR